MAKPDPIYPPPQGSKPRLEYHSPDVMVVDERYQRGCASNRSKSLIRRILAGWNWNYFGVVLATDNGDGTYCVIDGQHRVEAARQHPAINAIPVMVIDEMSFAEQARTFAEINLSRISLNPLQIHRAKIAAGDATARSISLICAEVGVIVPPNIPAGGCSRPGETLSVKTLYDIHNAHGGAALQRTLKICMNAYSDSVGDLRSQVIRAVCLACMSTTVADAEISRRLADRQGGEWQAIARLAGGGTVANLARILAGMDMLPKENAA